MGVPPKLGASCMVLYPPGIPAMEPICSRSIFSCSMRARSAFVIRALRAAVFPPREPAPLDVAAALPPET